MRSGLQHMTFGVSFNLSLEKVALPDALETLTFGKCFNQPMEKATGRSLSGFGAKTAKGGKGANPFVTIHSNSWLGMLNSRRKLFSPRNIQHDVVSVQGPPGLNLTGWKMKPAKQSVHSELGNGIPTLFFQAKDWAQICPLGSLNQSALRIHKQKPANQVRSDQEGHLQGSEY